MTDQIFPSDNTPAEIKPRRTIRTEQAYHSRYRFIERQALKRLNYYGQEESYPGEIYANPKDIVDQLILHAETHTSNSVVTHKGAVLFTFNLLLERTPEAQRHILLAEISRASKVTSAIGGKYSKRDIGPRKRKMPERDLAMIQDALARYRGYNLNGYGLSAWIDATITAGLRPSEWESAELQMLDDPETGLPVPHLVCKNSKRKEAAPAFFDIAKAQQAHPDLEINNVFDMERHGIESTFFPREMSRSIPLSDEDAKIVQRHLSLISSEIRTGISFEQYYDKCRKLLDRVCADVFKGKKRYTLYSMRHQFAANGKNIFTREELALRMGHDSIRTAQNAYASRSHGNASFKEANKKAQQDSQTESQTQGGNTSK